MTEFLPTFLDIAFSLPTEPFTWLLMPVMLYWVLSIFGLFHVDLDGAVDGAIDGAADAALDGAADAVLDGAADAAIDGAADAVGDAVGDGVVDSLSDALDHGHSALDKGVRIHGALEGEHHGGGGGSGDEAHSGLLHKIFGKAGFSDLPRTLTLSLKLVFAWLFSFFGSLYVPGFQELASRAMWIGLLLAVATFCLAIAATAVAIQPLRKMVLAGYGPERRDLIGKQCTITTQRVDERFGQAELEGGASILQVRNPLGHPFQRGAKAVIYDYDHEKEVHLIAPLDELNPG